MNSPLFIVMAPVVRPIERVQAFLWLAFSALVFVVVVPIALVLMCFSEGTCDE